MDEIVGGKDQTPSASNYFKTISRAPLERPKQWPTTVYSSYANMRIYVFH